ncbi:hypothetical protein K9U39_11450 [Rhodoblastus acidophilus]|uniref:Uncharacterized protein n=1 Tax=Candidatus Rhodoblastus alkanivorans TaxID=2954117 RepID=A0ABS9ZAK2_9HYPH|nr:hypothetical protein [Candidatus Rhodoblastus alkanivorans]MCI4678849.1 hypothetical protein [Candidatus Rhodoblastus alkanivorans]MCI4684227.1 hypothetical protein [Candidatus Rhodoblastus alkanivorans]MDI4641548.1 hypothetical protein [Rhodoblastus acidophilus]
MASKADFKADEWQKLLGAPMLAGLAVTFAEPSGLFGVLKESMASSQALIEAKNAPGAIRLVKEIGDAMGALEDRNAAKEGIQAALTGRSKEEMKAQTLAALAEIGRIADAKAPDDALAFKIWLKQVAERVAEAASEGGFLGLGGVQVTEVEKATIAEVAKALNVA